MLILDKARALSFMVARSERPDVPVHLSRRPGFRVALWDPEPAAGAEAALDSRVLALIAGGVGPAPVRTGVPRHLAGGSITCGGEVPRGWRWPWSRPGAGEQAPSRRSRRSRFPTATAWPSEP